MRTREQRRAEIVARLVSGVPGALREAYGSRAHSFGVMVRTNGLVRTMSFLNAKARSGGQLGRAYAEFSGHLATALAHMRAWTPNSPDTTRDEFQEHLSNPALGLSNYMSLTRESLALADWFKRFSVSILGVKPGLPGGDA